GPPGRLSVPLVRGFQRGLPRPRLLCGRGELPIGQRLGRGGLGRGFQPFDDRTSRPRIRGMSVVSLLWATCGVYLCVVSGAKMWLMTCALRRVVSQELGLRKGFKRW